MSFTLEKTPKDYHKPAEEALIGLCLNNSILIYPCILVPENALYFQKHQHIWDAIKEYYFSEDTDKLSGPVDLSWILSYLLKKRIKNIKHQTLVHLRDHHIGHALNLMWYIGLISMKQSQRERGINDEWVTYDDYLQSWHWKQLSSLAKESAGFRCMICDNDQNTLHTHHRTYKRITEEMPEDIIVLCSDCHELFHKEKRNGQLEPKLLKDLKQLVYAYSGASHG